MTCENVYNFRWQICINITLLNCRLDLNFVIFSNLKVVCDPWTSSAFYYGLELLNESSHWIESKVRRKKKVARQPNFMRKESTMRKNWIISCIFVVNKSKHNELINENSRIHSQILCPLEIILSVISSKQNEHLSLLLRLNSYELPTIPIRLIGSGLKG